MAVEGSITIGIGANTDKFDKQIMALEKRIKKQEDKKITLDVKMKTQTEDLDNAREKYKQLTKDHKEWIKLQDMPDKTVGQMTRMQELQNQYGSVEKLNDKIEQAYTKQEKAKIKVQETQRQYESINKEVDEYKQKIENVKIEKQVADVEKLKSGFNNVGSSIQGAVKHVARLALGIFGIRSAFMFLKRASSDLASYDQQYATNLEYIRYALTQMIAPVLQWIVNLAAKLLGYINAIMQAWFGINLFSRGSAKNFQKMKAGAGGVAKAVKEIKKQLAGFDEINMLTDQSDSGAGGGGGAGGAIPDFDLSAMQGEPPAWLQWIIDHKDEILSVLAGIAGGLLAIKLGATGLQALGIGAMITGILWTIGALKDYLEAPTWNNFGRIIQGIGIFLAGLLGIILGFPGVVVGVVVFIAGTIIKHWETIRAFLQGGIDWLKEKSDWVHEIFGDTIGNIYDTFVENLQLILNWFDMTFKNIKQILDGIIQFVKGVFTGDWKMAWDGLMKIVGAVWDWIKSTIKTAFQLIVNIADQAINAVKGFFNLMWTGIKAGASAAWNFIKSIFGGIASWFGGVINNVINMFRNFGTKAGEVIGGAFKGAVNGVLRAIENILNSPIRAINGLISVINAVPGINLSRLNTFSLPRLASGGIVNMPNRRNNARRCNCRREW